MHNKQGPPRPRPRGPFPPEMRPSRAQRIETAARALLTLLDREADEEIFQYADWNEAREALREALP